MSWTNLSNSVLTKLLCSAAILVGATAATAQNHSIRPVPMQEWREVARAGDEAQIDEWQASLVTAVLAAQENNKLDLYREDRPLYSPNIDLEQRSIPVGEYSCATINIHKGVRPGRGYYAYQPFSCRVSEQNGVRMFEKLTGSQRTKGILYDAPDVIGDVYLGTINNEGTGDYAPYGSTVRGSEGAVIQSLGDGRYRMIFPGNLNGGSINLLEIKPR